MTNLGPIVLLTDFGQTDPYVGIMKGVLQGIVPGVICVDLTHDLPPGDLLRAAITLWQARAYFPPGSVFLVVVDPGVGTRRRGLAITAGGRLYVGPDNGVFSFVIREGSEIWSLEAPEYQLARPSSTFHGRDIFAPAAAHLTRGVLPQDFGPRVDDPITLPAPRLASPAPGLIQGEVLHADRFGNLLTSLGQFLPQGQESQFRPWLPGVPERTISHHDLRVSLPNGAELNLVETFAQIPTGQGAGLIGSSGLLELAANQRSAAQLLGLVAGDLVEIHY